jgi:hypothetical protein
MTKRSNPDSEANIRRIDSRPKALKQTHGFQVHFLRRGDAMTKMFSDTVYGGKESARRAARKFRRMALAELPPRAATGFATVPPRKAVAAKPKAKSVRTKSKSAGSKAKAAKAKAARAKPTKAKSAKVKSTKSRGKKSAGAKARRRR